MSLIRFVPTEENVLNDLVNQLDITYDQREQVIRENKKTGISKLQLVFNLNFTTRYYLDRAIRRLEKKI